MFFLVLLDQPTVVKSSIIVRLPLTHYWLRGHNWVHFAHRPYYAVALILNFATFKTRNYFLLDSKNYLSLNFCENKTDEFLPFIKTFSGATDL